jgi:large subunit ribosomal protein L5
MPRLKKKYQEEVAPKLVQEFGIKNKMAVPKITKIVINMGVGAMIKNKELKDIISRDLAAITGQIPSVRLAKVSVAAFDLRRGMPVGLTVTLRGNRMYEFLDKLISITLPRLRDFRGVSIKSFDKSGNYTLGLNEHTVFPEIDLTKVGSPRGLEISIVTNSKGIEKAKRLLELLGMPFTKEDSVQGKLGGRMS